MRWQRWAQAKDRISVYTALIAIVCVTALEVLAIRAGIDGAALAAAVAVIGAIAGGKITRIVW